MGHAAAIVDTVVFWISAAACLFFAQTKRWERVNRFFYSAMAFLVINAAICATFAGVYDRYQSRVAWLIPLCLTGYVCCLAREWKRGVVQERAQVYDLDAFPADNPET